MNKKIVGLGLAAVATLALGACSRSNSSSSSSDSSVKAAIITDTGGVDDKSFNQSAWEGLQAWGKENDLTKILTTLTSNQIVSQTMQLTLIQLFQTVIT